jgi:Carboxypeptidase regulatory-like domain/TonB-dependent Receptor Plug Domain
VWIFNSFFYLYASFANNLLILDMTRTLRYLLLFILTGIAGSAIAQEIAGTVADDKKEPLINATVQVFQGGILKGGTVTDYDGNFSIKPLEPGYYDVIALYNGYDSMKITNVIVVPGERTTQNFTMQRHVAGLANVVIVAYKKPLVDKDKPDAKIFTKDEIAQVPTNQVADVVALTPGVYQSQRGSDVSIGGARSTGTTYMIDGVMVQSTVGIDMAQGSIDELEVISSGIPARYGDVSGGIVNLTTRGVAQKLTGDVRLQHSIDGYNNNLASFSVAGPLLKKGEKGHKKPVLGFSFSGDYYDDHDRYPQYYNAYETKPGVLSQLQQSPLHATTDASGNPVFYPSSDFISASQLQQVKITPFDEVKEVRLGGKLDYQLTDNMHIIAGGTFDYTKQDLYNRGYSLFAPDASGIQNTYSGRAYVRFTQKFGKINDTSAKHSIISNAYYEVQGDYQKLYQSVMDPKFKTNIFQYEYVGKFKETYEPIYFQNAADSLSGKTATVLQFTAPIDMAYQRDPQNRNPLLENYTSQLYNYFNNAPGTFQNYQQVQAKGGMMNGDEPLLTYGLFYSPGESLSYYTKFNSDQYSFSVDASFDLLLGKTKHAIEFGMYYQQRIERTYTAQENGGVGTYSLWYLARSLVSSIDNGGLVLDKTHPIFVINGQKYNYSQGTSATGDKFDIFTDANGNVKNVIPGPNDTVFYNYKNISNSTFDQNLRKELHLNSTTNINIDTLDPSKLSLGLFTADELLAQGQSFVNYQGYTYTGGTQSGAVNFNDFWTQKDANGNYTRPLAPFSPNYVAGYIQDVFNYKDLHFNVGVRIDRYSANTKVLKDPYSLYAENTVSQVSGADNVLNGGKHPGNIGGNYVVYVDNYNSPTPSIVGYRNGNNWYDAYGNYINNPQTLTNYTGGRDPQPYLNIHDTANIQSNTFNPNNSFTDYTPKVTLQPRLSFSFPISDVADFYAHYDIYSQRPTSNIDATALTYYYLQNNANLIINNPNLTPQKTFDYEVGFQQKLSDHSALTLSAFYTERKDMITIVPELFAYPTTYYSYGNRDFSSTKGTKLYYDLRATNHLRMGISYTLQFAEGTGSDPTSTNSGGSVQISPNGLLQSFIEAGLPNLRYVMPLNIDSRHNIAADIDYRYKYGEGPVVSGQHVLQNAGIHFVAKARSGEPYTRYAEAAGNTVIGGVNGSRLPWHYGLDMRIDKDFALQFGPKKKDAPEGIKPKRPLSLKAILQVNNLLNTRDILSVYGYTGKPNDNGYLASPYGQQFVPQQVNPSSYTTLYTISENSPYNYNYARTISFALEFNF